MIKMKNINLCLLTLAMMTACAPSRAGSETNLPAWAIGPFARVQHGQPVISPNTNTTFDCPLSKAPVHWEKDWVYNPAAMVRDGKIVVLYRAQQGPGNSCSRVGYAVSEDGIHFKKDSSPVLFPQDDSQKSWEWGGSDAYGGCEDPRLAESPDGFYVLTYTEYCGSKWRLGLAVSKDLKNWIKLGSPFAGTKYENAEYKSASIVTEVKDGRLVAAKIKGKYWMYFDIQGTKMATSEDMVHWKPIEDDNGKPCEVMPTRRGFFDSGLDEIGPPAVLTKNGIVVFYNGMNATGDDRDPSRPPGIYCGGQALFDWNDPTKLIARLDQPYIEPEFPWEKTGLYKEGTTFTQGLVFFKNQWFVYFGCADSFVGAVVAPATDTSLPASSPDAGAPVFHQDGTLVFDGSQDGFVSNNVAGLPVKAGDSWTMNFCAYMDNPPANPIIAGFGSGNGDTPGAQRFIVRIDKGGIRFWGHALDLDSGTPFDTGKWQMLTVTYDGETQTLTLFKNGESILSQSATLADAEPSVKIGGASPWGGSRFAGKIKDFSIWNSVLPAETIKKLRAKAGLLATAESHPAPHPALNLSLRDKPAYDNHDVVVSGATILARLANNGKVCELWSGMSDITRRTPIFVEFSGRPKIQKNGAWLDLTTLHYRDTDSRPGWLHLESEDGTVTCEISAKKTAPKSPVFLKYTFTEPVNFRFVAQWKNPELIQLKRTDDDAGLNDFVATWRCWRDPEFPLDKIPGPALTLATWPAGKTVRCDEHQTIREISSTREVVVCFDATDSAPPKGKNYVEAWKSLLGGYKDSDAERNADRVQITTGDGILDRLFSDSIDAVESLQFANGVIEADPFNYRDAWVRDGGYSTLGLALIGNFKGADAFFDFWAAQPGFGWVGGEDEAQQGEIGVLALWYYSRLRPDGDSFLKKHWDYVEKVSNYMQKRVADEGMLDLADEWISSAPTKATWPNAEVYAGLIASAKIANKLGQVDQAQSWSEAATRLKEKFDATAYDATLLRFIPYAPGKYRNGHEGIVDTRADSGMFNLARLEIFGKGEGIVTATDPRFAATQVSIAKLLEKPTHLIGRFDALPGSPSFPEGQAAEAWPLGSSWAAQTEWLQGRTDAAWNHLQALAQYRAKSAGGSNYLPERWDAGGNPANPILVWSHGEFLTAMVLLTLGVDLEPADADLGLAPSLPPGSDHATVKNFRFQNWRLDFDLTRDGDHVLVRVKPHFQGDGKKTLRIALPGQKYLSLKPEKSQTFSVSSTPSKK